MAVYRVQRTRDYTVMSNYHLKDKGLTLKSKGLLSMILSLPEEWNYTTRGLASICKEGVDAIGSALKELETAGYIVRRQLRGANGRITDTEYIIYEQPQPKKLDMLPSDVVSPDTENPDTVKPDTEKPAELNIEKSNTEKSITYGSSTDSIPFRETAAARPPERKGRDAMSVTEIENYRELILENIEYDCLKQRYPLYLDDLNEIVELLVETVCARRKTTRISGADFPHEIVRSRFLKLDSSHIEFVMDCLQKNTTQVRNRAVSQGLIELGERIRKRRREVHLSQEAFAEKVGISVNTVSRVEGGQTAMSIEIFKKMVEILEVDADDLLGKCPKEKEKNKYDTLVRRIQQLKENEQKIVMQTMEVLIDGINKFHK